MTRSLLVTRRVLCCALLVSVSAAAAAGLNPGYLAVVGPASLRLAAEPKPLTNKFVLPPPKPVPAADIPKMPTAPLPSSTLSEHVASPPPAAAPSTQFDGPLPAIAPAPQEGEISPQMLLRFFGKPATNAPPPVVTPSPPTPPRIYPGP